MTSDTDIKVKLCQTMKELYREKILTDIGGNLSFRSTENDDQFWITPSGIKKDIVEISDLVRLSTINGEILEARSDRVPSVEWPMHQAILNEDEDFRFVVHAHPPFASALSVVKIPPKFPQLTGELTYLVPEIIIVPYQKSGTSELGAAAAEALWDCSIVILENHGIVSVSEGSFTEAAMRIRALEEYLQLYLTASRFGELREFPGF
ncbi:MAG: class II aldolase/adducin family protein [Candidatus Thorarchaeota archaeon]